MDLATLPSVLAVTDFWMSRWLTPIWFLGVGVSAGLAILAALIGIFYLMSIDTFARRSIHLVDAPHLSGSQR